MAQFGDGYVGTAEDSARIRRQNKQRDEQHKKFQELSKQSQDRINNAGLRQFGASTTEALEHAFKNETIGLVTKAEFVQKRTTLQERIEEEQRKRQREDEDAAANLKERRKKERLNGAFKPKLSFLDDEEEEEEHEEPPPAVRPAASDAAPPAASAPDAAAAADAAGASAAGGDASTTAAAAEAAAPGSAEALIHAAAAEASAAAAAMLVRAAGGMRKGRLGKDPSVRSDFLPDKDRERQEEDLRKQLKKEWTTQQEKVKAEPLEITFSYWNGSGHRRKVSVKQGDSISGFLKTARDQLAPDFRELRATSVDNLLFIKEDLIMPHHCTFHELIVSKARGKSGPLFNFTVHEDIRVVNDASVEKSDTHAGKVVERHWYDRNKHIFPANRWEVWDPEKNYENYSIYGE